MKISLFKKLIVVATIALSSSVYAINFEVNTNWNSVLEKAKKENKIIFVDAYATWCGPCKQMDKNVFSEISVSKYFDKNFINYKIDMESERGLLFDEIYNVEAYPTLIFINADGEVIKKIVGAVDVSKLLTIGNYIAEPTTSEITLMRKQIENGESESDFLKSYLLKIRNIDEYDSKVAEILLSKIEKNQLVEDHLIFVIIYETPFSPNSKLGDLFSANFIYFVNQYGEYAVGKLLDISQSYLDDNNYNKEFLIKYVHDSFDDELLSEVFLSLVFE